MSSRSAYFISWLTILLLLPFVANSQDSSRIVLRFAGDVLLGGHYERAAGTDVGMAFHGFALLKTCDAAIVNLENPVTTRGEKASKPFTFRMHPRFLKGLKEAGVFAVSLANNHVFDYAQEGLDDTFRWLDSSGIQYLGAGRNRADAHKPLVIEKGGQRIAVFGYYGGREAPAAGRNSGGVAFRDLRSVIRDIKMARENGASYIVVILHWGTEKEEQPDASQRWFARSLIDAGADAVIGHHPHVLQGIERYRSGVIVYSLGNFLFGGNSRSTYETALFEIVLQAPVPAYRFIPVGVKNWHLVELAGKDSLRVWERVRRLSQVFPNTIP